MDSVDGGELLCLDKGSGEALPVIVTPRLTVGAEQGEELKCGCCLLLRVGSGWVGCAQAQEGAVQCVAVSVCAHSDGIWHRGTVLKDK